MTMVTVVVPIFNMEAYLHRCMESLLRQTDNNIEIILVDDGSTDNSSLLCEEYSKSYPCVKVIHKTNGGLSSARNAGIEIASGEYISFPDPDDWVESDYIECFSQLGKKYHADMVCTGYFIEYEHNTRVSNPGASCKLMNQVEALKALIISPAMEGFAWNKLFRLDIIRQYQLRFSDSMGTTEDLAFAYQYLKHCDQVCFAPEKRTYHYVQRIGSATVTSFSQTQLQSMKVFEMMAQESDDPVFSQVARMRQCDMAMNLLWRAQNSHLEDLSVEKMLQRIMKQSISAYMCSSKISFGRKAQYVCALLSPKLYRLLKNLLTKEQNA